MRATFPFERYRRLRFGGRPRCPHCDEVRVHRWGGFAGRRRYRCVACRRTFSDFTGTPLVHLKRVDQWPGFCHCFRKSLSVRATASRLGIHKDTAFRWRHRLLRRLDLADTTALGPTVTFDETWFPFSEKGSRRLDRPPRRRAAYRRCDTTPAWVFVARDGAGRVATGASGQCRPTVDTLVTALASRIERDVEILSTAGPYSAPGMLAVRLDARYRRPPRGAPEVAAVRSYIWALRRWTRRFRGVATRYLHHYLAWHRFLTSADGLGDELATDFVLATRFP